MPELRYNFVSSEWVIIAAERARRPEEFSRPREEKEEPPVWVESCPLCPGNELQTPPEIFRLEEGGEWKVRVVPNKYPALAREGEKEVLAVGTQRMVTGVGIHDLVVDTPKHNMIPAWMSVREMEILFLAYRRRYREIMEDPRVEMVIVFKNYGQVAGSSIEHPHSQIVGAPMVSIQVRSRMEELVKYHDLQDGCALCNMIEEEKEDKERVVIESDHFLAFIPFAALSPFHTWIFPKRHCACFGMVTDHEIRDLARVLQEYLQRLNKGLGDPPFNYVIRSSPKVERNAPYFHWYLSLVPRVSTTAGFELGSGMYINTALPEKSARFLREIQI